MYFCYFEWNYFQFKMYCNMGIFSFLMQPSKTHRLVCTQSEKLLCHEAQLQLKFTVSASQNSPYSLFLISAPLFLLRTISYSLSYKDYIIVSTSMLNTYRINNAIVKPITWLHPKSISCTLPGLAKDDLIDSAQSSELQT